MIGRNSRSFLARTSLLSILALIVLSRSASATVFDFNGGIAPDFRLDVSGADLFTKAVSGPDVVFSKGGDVTTSTEWIYAGVASNFCMASDFSVTVDYALPIFNPDLSNLHTSVKSVLWAMDSDGSPFEVGRIALGDGGQYVYAYDAYGGSLSFQAAPASIVSSGRYRITRTAGTITAWYAPAGSETFTSIGSVNGHIKSMKVGLYAGEGLNSGGFIRAHNAMEAHFDNAIVTGISEPLCVPIANTAGLLVMGFVMMGMAVLAASRMKLA